MYNMRLPKEDGKGKKVYQKTKQNKTVAENFPSRERNGRPRKAPNEIN